MVTSNYTVRNRPLVVKLNPKTLEEIKKAKEVYRKHHPDFECEHITYDRVIVQALKYYNEGEG